MYQLLSIFLTSLLGSTHCIAMCGGFAVLSSTSAEKTLVSAACYHFGRLISYLLLGTVVSFAQETFQQSVLFGILSRAYGFGFGGLLLFLGFGLFFAPRKRLPDLGMARLLTRFYRASVSLLPRTPYLFRLGIGFFSTLLPCGWLYLALGLAATTPYPILAMFSFWLGTLPALTAWIGFGNYLFAHASRLVPVLRAVALCIAGITTLVVISSRTTDTEPLHCHDAGMSLAFPHQ